MLPVLDSQLTIPSRASSSRGVIGSVLGMTQFQQDFPTSQQGSISGAIVSVFAGGAVIGAAAAGYLCDKLGRKRAIQVCLATLLHCFLTLTVSHWHRRLVVSSAFWAVAL